MSVQIPKKDKKKIIQKYLDYTFEDLQIDGYEAVYKITNEKTKLFCIIALHSSELGIPLGGTRIFNYSNFNDALTDVLRLSKGMTYKAAIAEVGLGGGKSVIIVDDLKDKNEALMKSFGEAVDLLNGRYVCAEDMNCSVKDVSYIQTKTKYVVGLPHEKSSGNPSRYTAYGVIQGIKATLKKLFNTSSIKNKTIAIQGLGSVGEIIIEHFFWAGANLIISDLDKEKAEKLSKIYGAKVVDADEIYKQKADIFVPCAIGGIINDESIDQLNCLAVCGCANNQLLEERHADMLKEKNILYAPDFVVNAGGLINVSVELEKNGYDPKIAKEKTDIIFKVLLEIYEMAYNKNISTHKAAMKLADLKIKSKTGLRKSKLYFHHSE